MKTIRPETTPVRFDEFFRANHVRIGRAVVLTVGNGDLGREAADEAFVRALARWDEVSAYGNPQGWVFRVAVNWGRSQMRRKNRETGSILDEPATEPPVPEPELLDAIEDLPTKYRAVIVARFFLDWTVEATADALGLKETTVRTRQHRALRSLRRTLEEYPS
jgi:RNA polymerase sigma factor (sigma-70 family)